MSLKSKNLLKTLLIIALAISISIIPDLYRQKIAPTGTSFPFIHNHPEDYFSYLSYMHQGLEGKWLVFTRFTSEHFHPVLVFTLFALLGYIGKFTNISLPWLYFLSRIILGFTLLFIITLLCKQLFKKNNQYLLALSFVAFSNGFWTIDLQSKSKILPVKQFLPFWSHLDPVLRTTFLPHHLLSLCLGILSIILLDKAVSKNSLSWTFLAGILGLLSGFIFYAAMINIYGGIILALFLMTIKIFRQMSKKLKIRQKLKIIIGRLIYPILYLLTASFTFLYLLFLTHSVFPWTSDSNLGWQFTFHFSVGEYLAMLGPTLILTLIGLPIMFKTDSLLPPILFGWALTPFLGIYLFTPLYPRYGNMPFLEGTSYIPLGILAVFGIRQLEFFLKNRKIIFIFIALLFLYFIPPIITSVQKESFIIPTYYYNRFIPNGVFDAFKWLDNNSPPESVVLAGGFFGNIIPAFTHDRVVYGHDMTTYNSNLKHSEVNEFFNQNDPVKAREILIKNNVSFVFYSYDTDPPKDSYIKSLNLERIFDNNSVKIFKVPNYSATL